MPILKTNGRGGCSFQGVVYEALDGYISVPDQAVDILLSHCGYTWPTEPIPQEIVDIFYPKPVEPIPEPIIEPVVEPVVKKIPELIPESIPEPAKIISKPLDGIKTFTSAKKKRR